MENKYYVLLENRNIYGPYTFEKAIHEQNEWRDCGRVSIILKEAIDIEGKGVK